MPRLVLVLVTLVLIAVSADAQSSSAREKQAEEAFNTANELMEKRKFAEALVHYKKALAALPDNGAILFNGGLAAFESKDYEVALELWKRLELIEPTDWHVRAKLVQVYQALNKLPERDVERAELIAMWKLGKPAELKEQFEYCRDQFEVNAKKVMAFEHFELKGPRALRYVFSILNEAGDNEAWRISFGSYDTTNAVWSETTKNKPREGERLFHLDGYFAGGGHATYGMFPPPEPTYDAIRAKVIQILSAAGNPISTTTPAAPKTDPKPKP